MNEELFWSKVEKTDSCWLWTARLNRDGYGATNIKNPFNTPFAHRISYGLRHGSVPPYPEFELDHKCKNRNCVNPDHLEPVPHEVNVARGDVLEATRQRQLSKTHCPQGHEYNEANTYVAPKVYPQNGRMTQTPARMCRICRRAHHKLWLQKKRNSK